MSKVDSRFEPGLGDTCDWSHHKSDSLANMTKMYVKPRAQDLGKERVLNPQTTHMKLQHSLSPPLQGLCRNPESRTQVAITPLDGSILSTHKG